LKIGQARVEVNVEAKKRDDDGDRKEREKTAANNAAQPAIGTRPGGAEYDDEYPTLAQFKECPVALAAAERAVAEAAAASARVSPSPVVTGGTGGGVSPASPAVPAGQEVSSPGNPGSGSGTIMSTPSKLPGHRHHRRLLQTEETAKPVTTTSVIGIKENIPETNVTPTPGGIGTSPKEDQIMTVTSTQGSTSSPVSVSVSNPAAGVDLKPYWEQCKAEGTAAKDQGGKEERPKDQNTAKEEAKEDAKDQGPKDQGIVAKEEAPKDQKLEAKPDNEGAKPKEQANEVAPTSPATVQEVAPASPAAAQEVAPASPAAAQEVAPAKPVTNEQSNAAPKETTTEQVSPPEKEVAAPAVAQEVAPSPSPPATGEVAGGGKIGGGGGGGGSGSKE
jgi:hypothetical protein